MPKRKKVHPRELLGPLEAQVMAAVWRHPGLSGIEATTLVNDKRDTPLSPAYDSHRAPPARGKGLPVTRRRRACLSLHGRGARERLRRVARAVRAITDLLKRYGDDAVISGLPGPRRSTPAPLPASTSFSSAPVGVRRSFWVLVVIASTVEGITILLLWRAAAAQLPCHFSFLPMNVAAAPGASTRCRSSGGEPGSPHCSLAEWSLPPWCSPRGSSFASSCVSCASIVP